MEVSTYMTQMYATESIVAIQVTKCLPLRTISFLGSILDHALVFRNL